MSKVSFVISTLLLILVTLLTLETKSAESEIPLFSPQMGWGRDRQMSDFPTDLYNSMALEINIHTKIQNGNRGGLSGEFNHFWNLAQSVFNPYDEKYTEWKNQRREALNRELPPVDKTITGAIRARYDHIDSIISEESDVIWAKLITDLIPNEITAYCEKAGISLKQYQTSVLVGLGKYSTLDHRTPLAMSIFMNGFGEALTFNAILNLFSPYLKILEDKSFLKEISSVSEIERIIYQLSQYGRRSTGASPILREYIIGARIGEDSVVPSRGITLPRAVVGYYQRIKNVFAQWKNLHPTLNSGSVSPTDLQSLETIEWYLEDDGIAIHNSKSRCENFEL